MYYIFFILTFFFFLVFLEVFIFATLFWRWSKLWNSALKMAMLFRRCLTLFISTLKYTTLFQRWFDVVLRHKFYRKAQFPHIFERIAMYQPNDNVETTLKCLLGRPLQWGFRTSRMYILYKTGVLEKFTKFTRKHLCWSLFLNNV